jgi:acetyl esterase/lipase
MIDDRQATPSSQLDDLVIFDREASEFGWRCHLGDLYGKPEVPAYAAPARAADLRGLPPAYICVGNVDGFRDDATGYATRLNQAGVPAELHVYAGAPHGVKQFADVPVARRYIDRGHQRVDRRSAPGSGTRWLTWAPSSHLRLGGRPGATRRCPLSRRGD